MLILSRKKDESIIITVPPSSTPTRIVVACVELRGDKARLGIDAPRQVSVNRSEVQEAIERGEVSGG